MTRLVAPRGHAELLEGLWRAARDGRLPHALLFEGPAGIGKFLAARYFTAGMLCEAGPGVPCGRCGACHRLESGGEQSNHPGLLEIDPIGEGAEVIKVGHIAFREGDSSSDAVPLRRTVEGFLDLMAQEGSTRVVVLREAGLLNRAAQNALLKTLEEPRDGVLIILVASRTDSLLDTVISRVTRVRFEPLDEATCRELILEREPSLDAARAARLARMAAGCPGQALTALAEGRPLQLELLLDVLGGRRGPIDAARAMWQLEGDFPGKTERGRERSRARCALNLALQLVRELGTREAGQDPAKLSLAEHLTALAPQGRTQLAALRGRLLQARSDIDANLTPGAVLDGALLALARLAPKRP